MAREALTRREAIASQLKDLETQHASVDDQLQKLEATATKLQTEIEAFRTRKETIKATYTAAEASAHVNEAVSGISTSMGDAGAAMQRAQDKVASDAGAQWRAGRVVGLRRPDRPHRIRTTTSRPNSTRRPAQSDIDAQLAALKATGTTTQLPAGTSDAPAEAPTESN